MHSWSFGSAVMLKRATEMQLLGQLTVCEARQTSHNQQVRFFFMIRLYICTCTIFFLSFLQESVDIFALLVHSHAEGNE